MVPINRSAGIMCRFFRIMLVVAAGAVIVSCTDFFSTSWAKFAARDPNKLIPAVTAGNVNDLVAQTENNPDLSLAVLKKIQSAVNGGASDADKQKLQNAALEAAVNAAGLGQAVLGTVSQLNNIDLSDPGTAAGDALDIVLKAVGNMKNLDATSQALIATLPDPNDPTKNGDFDTWAAGASADNLAMAAAVLISGEINKNGKDILNNLPASPGSGTGTDSENLALAMALATTLDGRVDQLSGPMKSVLQGLNLLT